ncbi:hypothetical protein E5S70_36625 [Ensifer adhaerens]|nr:hypothetical protein [Ensifer canadensis]
MLTQRNRKRSRRRPSRLWATRCISERRETISSHLIPVLVTGIQLRRVGAVNESSSRIQLFGGKKPFSAADAALLDSCDKHRNEGADNAPLTATTPAPPPSPRRRRCRGRRCRA